MQNVCEFLQRNSRQLLHIQLRLELDQVNGCQEDGTETRSVQAALSSTTEVGLMIGLINSLDRVVLSRIASSLLFHAP